MEKWAKLIRKLYGRNGKAWCKQLIKDIRREGHRDRGRMRAKMLYLVRSRVGA